ncbi:HNH endonuclease family protein, partial [Klebsiella pneumoniae]
IKTGEYMPDSLTLEHIYPQSSGRHEVYSMIGNLLPLSKELNEKAGNKSVKDKINIYKESKYALVQIFVDQFENRFEERWESDLILLRTTELCDLSYNSVWKLG